MTRIKQGEDFIRLVREHWDSPTAAQDGDLGFMQRGHAIPEIEQAAKDLQPGNYAGPLQAADGFYLIRVEEVRTPVRPFEKVKDEIQKMLYEQMVKIAQMKQMAMQPPESMASGMPGSQAMPPVAPGGMMPPAMGQGGGQPNFGTPPQPNLPPGQLPAEPQMPMEPMLPEQMPFNPNTLRGAG